MIFSWNRVVAWLSASCFSRCFDASVLRCFGALLLSVTLATTGCGQAKESDNTEIPTIPISPEKMSEQRRVYHQDVGVVRAGEKITCHFEIANETDGRYTFKSFHTTCTCAIAKPKKSWIDPHSSQVLEITYNAPNESKDTRQRIAIEFAEPDVSIVFLEIVAKVRAPLAVFPSRIEFTRIGRGHESTQDIEIQNHTKGDFGIRVTSSVAWLEVHTSTPIRSDARVEPRQKWRLICKARTAGLSSGSHQGSVVIRSPAENALQVEIPVRIHVSSPVEAIPASAFFGQVVSSSSRTYRILLRFTDEALPVDERSIKVSHDLGQMLQVSCSRGPGAHYQLTLELRPSMIDNKPHLLEGRVEVSFEKSVLPTLIIPVVARIEK